MDIEKVAAETPNKIITNKIDFKKDGPNEKEIEKIISIFNLMTEQKKIASQN
jgi:succinyl-CoA synthetase beta subunit